MPSGPCERCGVHFKWLQRAHLKARCQGGTWDDGFMLVCANCHHEIDGGPAGGEAGRERRWTPEVNAARAEAMRLNWQDPAYRERVQARRLKAEQRPAVKAKRSRSAKNYWSRADLTPEKQELRARHRQRLNQARGATAAAHFTEMQARDAEIAKLRTEGKTHKEIAAEVGCHFKTVRNVLRRLGLT